MNAPGDPCEKYQTLKRLFERTEPRVAVVLYGRELWTRSRWEEERWSMDRSLGLRIHDEDPE